MGRFDMLLPAALAAAALSGLAASPSFAADKPAVPITAQQAIDLQDKFLHALYGTDLNAISALLSEDVTFTHPNGMALDKKGGKLSARRHRQAQGGRAPWSRRPTPPRRSARSIGPARCAHVAAVT